jgi:rod shape-determining protein MreC
VATTRRNTSQRLTLVILLLASITVVTLDYRGDARHVISSVRNAAADVLSPLQRGAAAALHPIGNLFAGLVNYGSVLSDNERLQTEVDQLRQRLIQSQFDEQELTQILSQQHLPFVAGIPQVLAEVISSAPSNFDADIEIDRGTKQGVGPGMPVVSGAGLVGQVVSAGSDTALVRLITDPASQVGVRFGTATIAVAHGQGEDEPLGLEDVTTHVPRTGAHVVTSGLEGAAFPGDIPVGTVSFVQHAGGTLTSRVQVVPIVNLADLQYVTVLQWFPPA